MAFLDSLKRFFGEDAFDWVDRSYMVDWVVVVFIWILSFIVSGTAIFEREFSLKDSDISHPHKPNQIGSHLNHAIALYVPILLVVIVGGLRKSLMEVHHGVISVTAARGVARLITEFLKHKVGRLRPDFLARCKWDKVLKACTGKADAILDGRKSFPSGHSSTAFAGMTFLFLWLAGQTAAWAFHTPRPISSWKASRMASFFLTLFPLAWATFVAVTRIEDYRHHKEDVLVGSFIGIASASVCYMIFWPNPFSARNFTQYSSGRPRLLYHNSDARRPNGVEFELTRVRDDDDIDVDIV